MPPRKTPLYFSLDDVYDETQATRPPLRVLIESIWYGAKRREMDKDFAENPAQAITLAISQNNLSAADVGQILSDILETTDHYRERAIKTILLSELRDISQDDIDRRAETLRKSSEKNNPFFSTIRQNYLATSTEGAVIEGLKVGNDLANRVEAAATNEEKDALCRQLVESAHDAHAEFKRRLPRRPRTGGESESQDAEDMDVWRTSEGGI